MYYSYHSAREEERRYHVDQLWCHREDPADANVAHPSVVQPISEDASEH